MNILTLNVEYARTNIRIFCTEKVEIVVIKERDNENPRVGYRALLLRAGTDTFTLYLWRHLGTDARQHTTGRSQRDPISNSLSRQLKTLLFETASGSLRVIFPQRGRYIAAACVTSLRRVWALIAQRGFKSRRVLR